MDKIIQFFTTKDSKKKIENSILLIVILVILLISFNYVFTGEKNESKKNIEDTNIVECKEDELEIKIAKILDEINGIQNSKVLITYKDGEKKVPIYEISESSENEKKQIERKIAYEEIDGDKIAIVETNEKPSIEGVIVVAEGITTEDIKLKIVKAISAVTDVPEYKVQLFNK